MMRLPRKPLRRAITLAGILIFILMVFLSLIILVFYSNIESGIFTFISSYSYFAIFIISFLLDLLMQPLGPDIVIVGGIFLKFNAMAVILYAVSGSVIASFIGYYIGRAYGRFGFKRRYYRKQYGIAKRLYARYGKLGLSIAAITPLPYVPLCWIAGIFKMKKIDFILFGILPRTARFTAIAYFAHLLTLI